MSVSQFGDLLTFLDAEEENLDSYSERILEAAEQEFSTHGLARTSLDAIAKTAGVGRATLFRRFINRDALLRAVVMREAKRFIAEFDAVVSAVEEADERFVTGVVTAARMLTGDSLLRRLLATDPELVLPALTIHADRFFAVARSYVVEQMRRLAETGAPVGDPTMAAEIFIRVAHSMALAPAVGLPVDEDRLREFARNNFLPLIRGTGS